MFKIKFIKDLILILKNFKMSYLQDYNYDDLMKLPYETILQECEKNPSVAKICETKMFWVEKAKESHNLDFSKSTDPRIDYIIEENSVTFDWSDMNMSSLLEIHIPKYLSNLESLNIGKDRVFSFDYNSSVVILTNSNFMAKVLMYMVELMNSGKNFTEEKFIKTIDQNVPVKNGIIKIGDVLKYFASTQKLYKEFKYDERIELDLGTVSDWRLMNLNIWTFERIFNSPTRITDYLM